MNVASDTAGELWHKRLCHMNVKGMKRLADDNLIPVKDVHLERCTDCSHAGVKSHAGAQYFVTFIDDHIRRLWATPLKTKDQVLSVLKELHARVERESGRKLKAVRADNGAVRRVLSLKGNPARIYRAENAETKRASREDEPDHNGKGPEYARTCQATQDVLG